MADIPGNGTPDSVAAVREVMPTERMALDQPDTIDAVGTDRETGAIILSIIDGWDWADECSHLSALQAKLNAYFEFVESGQIGEIEPAWRDAGTNIDVVFRLPPPDRAVALLQTAGLIASPLSLRITHRVLID